MHRSPGRSSGQPSPWEARLATLRTLVARAAASRWPLRVVVLLLLVGTAALIAAMVPVGPSWFGATGAIIVATGFTWMLAAREGGRPMVFGSVALALALVAVLSDEELLRTGGAVVTAAIAAVLGVMATVPTRGLLASAREAVFGTAIAAIGAMAAVGFEPAINVERFEYVVLGLALVGAFLVVFRLGAGFHGLGRRGLILVAIGAVLLSVTLLYAELLRSYGTSGFVDDLLRTVRWSRDTLGAFPRPISTLLGVPALVYGCHMRARRRQGWWVCAFGVAATGATATALANPAIDISESLLSVGYGLIVGILVGWLIIRLDLALTGNGGKGRRVAEQAGAVRPEPRRTEALL